MRYLIFSFLSLSLISCSFLSTSNESSGRAPASVNLACKTYNRGVGTCKTYRATAGKAAGDYCLCDNGDDTYPGRLVEE